MRLVPALLIAALAAGCASSHSRIDVGTASHGTPVAGTRVAGGAVRVEYPSSSAAPGIVILTALGLLIYSEAASGANPPDRLGSGREAPPLDPRRSVNEQDCSKPIESPTANLRCR